MNLPDDEAQSRAIHEGRTHAVGQHLVFRLNAQSSDLLPAGIVLYPKFAAQNIAEQLTNAKKEVPPEFTFAKGAQTEFSLAAGGTWQDDQGMFNKQE
jgi:hypothetical protein